MTDLDKTQNNDQVSEKFLETFKKISQKNGSIRQELIANLDKLDTNELVEFGVDVQKIQNEKFLPHPQPDPGQILAEWFEVYSNDGL